MSIHDIAEKLLKIALGMYNRYEFTLIFMCIYLLLFIHSFIHSFIQSFIRSFPTMPHVETSPFLHFFLFLFSSFHLLSFHLLLFLLTSSFLHFPSKCSIILFKCHNTWLSNLHYVVSLTLTIAVGALNVSYGQIWLDIEDVSN